MQLYILLTLLVLIVLFICLKYYIAQSKTQTWINSQRILIVRNKVKDNPSNEQEDTVLKSKYFKRYEEHNVF